MFFAAMDHQSIGCIGNGPRRLSVVCGQWSVTPFSGHYHNPMLKWFGYVVGKYNGL